MKVFITGATGFIGKHLAKRLIDDGGYEIICSGRNLRKLDDIKKKVKALYLDIEDKEAVEKALSEEKPEAVFHCAAIIKSFSLKRLRAANVEGTRNILEACLKSGVKRVVYLSSISAIGGNENVPLTDDLPLKAKSLYGRSKVEAERVADSYRNKGLKIAILRPCMVYGEDEPHLLRIFVNLIRRRLFPILSSGSNILHLVGVENLMDVMILSVSKEEACEETYLVADEEALEAGELVRYIADTVGAALPFNMPEIFKPLIKYIPFYGEFFSDSDRIYSIERLKKRLGYTPRVSIYEGLEKAVLSYQK
ncbi:MAG: NAD(P)-dependent oxidoreductase [Candidatus Omnitrophota bacterium]